MKPVEKQNARLLRSQGHSVKEISRQLHVSVGSVSAWVRDIRLTAAQIERLETRSNLNREHFGYLSRCSRATNVTSNAAARHRAFRLNGFERAKWDEEFRLICALYWGEGTKANRFFQLCNSDPGLLNVVLRWLVKEGYQDTLRFTVRYHPDNGLCEEEIKAWWRRRLPLLNEGQLRKFGQCLVHRASQRKKVGKLPYGTATLYVCRAELFFQVMGGIDYVRNMGA